MKHKLHLLTLISRRPHGLSLSSVSAAPAAQTPSRSR